VDTTDLHLVQRMPQLSCTWYRGSCLSVLKPEFHCCRKFQDQQILRTEVTLWFEKPAFHPMLLFTCWHCWQKLSEAFRRTTNLSLISWSSIRHSLCRVLSRWLVPDLVNAKSINVLYYSHAKRQNVCTTQMKDPGRLNCFFPAEDFMCVLPLLPNILKQKSPLSSSTC